MNVVDLMYDEHHWDERISRAGNWLEKSEKPKCLHGLFGLLGFWVGVLATYLFFMHLDMILDFVENVF